MELKMKKLILILAIVLLPAIVFAAPFLVCDAPPADQQVTEYEVYRDGVLYAIVPAEADGSLRYDLDGMTPGIYAFTGRAVNLWGASDFSNPTVSPAPAGSPSGVSLSL
jgi:hypothetical protein